MKTYASASDIEKLEIHKNPGVYLHLPDLPLELVKEVLLSSPSLYGIILNPSREVTLFLVRNHGNYLGKVRESDQDLEICLEAIKNNPFVIKHVKIGITEEMCREYFLSFVSIYNSQDSSCFKLASECIPEEILKKESFHMFLIDNGFFGFLAWINDKLR